MSDLLCSTIIIIVVVVVVVIIIYFYIDLFCWFLVLVWEDQVEIHYLYNYLLTLSAASLVDHL